MDWLQVLTIIGANFGLTIGVLLWIRSEASNDRREIAASVHSMMKTFSEETKDFHGRLCSIEARRKE